MAEAVDFVKLDNTDRTSTATTAEESTDYTIAWSDLTTAGFGGGDDVFILVLVKTRNSGANNNTLFQVGRGTTYAGRTDFADSLNRQEPPGTGADTGVQYAWCDRITLTANENFYFSKWTTAGTSTYDEFVCWILKLGSGISTNDFGYSETAPSGDAPVTYTAGASFTTPAAGDWLLIAMTRWLVDSTSANMLMRIDANGSVVSEWSSEGEDTADEVCMGTIAYRVGLGSGVTVEVEYRTDSTSHDCVATKIFGLRLDAFKDHAGAHTSNTITHSVLDTYQEFAGFPTYGASQTGNVLAIALPLHTPNEVTKRPYGRIQVDGADFDVANRNRTGAMDNGVDSRIGPLLFGYGSVSAGTRDIDFDVAEDSDVTPSYNCVEQIAAIFSLELAGAALAFPPLFRQAQNTLLRM